MRLLPYLLAGLLFGFTLVKGETVSWYRIQEMFHFQSFHMFGIMFSAIATGLIGVMLLRWRNTRLEPGCRVEIPKKNPGLVNYAVGGTLFGLGWGLAGLCPGPMFALSASGIAGVLVLLAGSVLGTYVYGCVKNRLPH